MKTIKPIFFFALLLIFAQSCKRFPYPMELGSRKYFLDYYDGMAYINGGGGFILIGPEIVAINYDSTFIIFKQRPYYNEVDQSINSPTNIHSVYYNYWIIDKRKELEHYYDETKKRLIYTGSVIGPLTYEAYWNKRRELGVPDTLKLLRTPKQRDFDHPVEAFIYRVFFSKRKIIE